MKFCLNKTALLNFFYKKLPENMLGYLTVYRAKLCGDFLREMPWPPGPLHIFVNTDISSITF